MSKKFISLYSLLIIAVVLFLAFIAYSRHSLVYDERRSFESLPLFYKYGASEVFLSKLTIASGVLYAPIHSAFSPLTSFRAPEVRFVSVFFLLCTICALAVILKQLKYSSWLHLAFLMLALPEVYVVFGMALTESYSMAFLACAVALSLFSFRSHNRGGWISAICAGIFWSLALLGRQSYLPALLVLTFIPGRDYKVWTKILIIIIIGFSPLCIVFSIWKSLVPPYVSYISEGLAPVNFFIALAYAGALFFILSPKWLFFDSKFSVISFLAGVILNFFNPLIVTPIQTIAKHLLKSTDILFFYSYSSGAIISGFAFLTISSLLWRLWERKKDKIYLYFTLAVLGILSTTIMITLQFSSRYVIMAAPFFILLTARDIQFTRMLLLRIIIGAGLGLLSLYSYLFLLP
jgi:hypothetical protein